MLKRSRLLALVAVLAAVAAGIALAQLNSNPPTPQSATGSVHPSGWGQTPPGLKLLAPAPKYTPTAEMFDAVVLGNVPGSPFAVAGYTAGSWPNYLQMRATWPRAHAISVAIQATYHAACLDVEPGDASPSSSGSWTRADIRAGFSRPCIYSDLSEMPAVKTSLAAAGLSRGQYLLWLAWYRNVPGLLAGYDAVQYTDSCLGRNLDCSTVSLAFLTAAQPPYVAPKPRPPLPLCFHRREAASACGAAWAKIASQQRAAASSQRALDGKSKILTAYKCVKPYRRGVCVRNGQAAAVFAQRARWFTAAAVKLEAAN